MRALSIRQPYAELILRGDQDGGAAVDLDDRALGRDPARLLRQIECDILNRQA
jgi:hypothetical protein